MLKFIFICSLYINLIFSSEKLNFSANSLETILDNDIEKQIFKDDVIITKNSLQLYTDQAIYYPDLDEVILINNVRMYDIQDTLFCDSLIFYNQENKTFKAFENVNFLQKKNKITCQKLEYHENSGFGNRLINIFNNAKIEDSLRIVIGDSIYVQYQDSLLKNIKILSNGEIINNRYTKKKKK